MPGRSDRASLGLTGLLVLLIATQAGWGRAAPALYRDPPRIALTWVGNDWINLAVIAPLLAVAAWLAARGGARARLVWIGGLGFAVYNYAFYLMGAALNAAFPLYVGLVLVAAVTLARVLLATAPGPAHAALAARPAARVAGGFLIAVGATLSLVWTALWYGILTGRMRGGLGPEAFQVVAALDMTLLVPFLVLGGVLLWRRHPWGGILAPAVAVQGALYLFVLSVNALAGLRAGHTDPPGEAVIWIPLCAATTGCALALLVSLGAPRRPGPEQ